MQLLVAGAPFALAFAAAVSLLVAPSVCLGVCGAFVALLLLCDTLPVPFSFVTANLCATTRLDWKNEHTEFGFCYRPDEMCSPMWGACGRGGEMEVVGMPVLKGQSQIDLFSTRGHHSTWEPIQAASYGSDCVSAS